MGEAVAVLGLVSAIITIVDATQRIYDAAQDVEGLPAAFKVISTRMPLVKQTLVFVKQKYERGEHESEIFQILTNTREKARGLREIFKKKKVCPADDDKRIEQYRKALRTLKPGRSDKVENLWKAILGNLQSLQVYHVFRQAVKDDDLRRAIQEIAEVESSLPESGTTNITSTGPGASFNTGTGTQENWQNYGSGAYGKGDDTDAEHHWIRRMCHLPQVFLPQLGPRDPSHTRPYHNSVPFSQISDEYTDRPAAMQQLEAALLERSSRWQHIRGAVVVGMAGTGKTQLILKYALVHAHEYDTILWVNADKPSSVVGSFELIARDLQLVDYNISLLSTAQVMPQQSTAVRNILEWLTKRTTPWLLILDNADEDDWGLRDILPRAGHGTVIITTQDRAIPRALKIKSVCLDVMLEEEAVALLLEAVGCTQWTENLALLELCTDVVRRLEYLPLAIHLAGATINCDAALLAAGPERVGICTRSAINGYLTAFQNNRSALLRDTNHDFLRSPHRTTVWTAWETTFQLLERARTKSGTGVSPNVLLTFLAFLDPAVILYTHLKDAHAGLLRGQDFPYYKVSDWPPWLLRLVSAEYSLSQTIGNKSCEWSHDCYSQTMSRLWRYGLIRSKNADWSEEISLHKLVRWRAQQEADEKEYLQAYAQLLELITWASSRNTSAYRIYYETDDYDLDDPSTRGRLIRTLDELCSTYERLRHWEAAHNKLGWLLHEQVESLGRSNPGTISTLCRKLEAGVHTVSGNEVEEISEFIHGGSQTEQMALVENLPLQLRTLWSSVLQRDKKSSHAGWSNGDSDDDGGVPLRLEGLVGVSGASSVHIMDSRSWLRRSMEAFVSRAYRRWEKHERRSQIRTQMRSIQRTVRRDETRLHDRGQKASQDTEAAAPDLPTLFEVFSHGSWSTVSNYLRFIDAETVRYRDPIQRRTILHWAAARGFDTAAVRCLAFGSDINAPRTTSAADLCIMLARISIWVWWKRLSNMEQTSLLRMPVA